MALTSRDHKLDGGDASPQRPMRVLLIDDNVLVLRSLARVLRATYVVETAESGASALEMLSKSTFDAIICDVMMPGMSGVEVLREILVRHPKLEQVFAFLTAGSCSPECADFLASVSTPVLLKPVSIRNLESTIRALSMASTGRAT